jgi:4-amino-4-deoxy-L-arabinose transferase-like glycosyltransferase
VKKIPLTIWLLLAVQLSLGVVFAIRAGLDFDEAFNLQIPLRLVEDHRYASLYLDEPYFDPNITTGPTVLLPIALGFQIFGINYFVARLVMLLYFLGFTLSLYFFSLSFLSSETAATLFTILIVVGIPLFPSSIHVLGEVPAVFYLIIGLLAMDRKRWFFSGFLLGLAALTKAIALFMVFALIAAWIWQVFLVFKQREKFSFRPLFNSLIGAALPLVGWEAVKLLTLGRGEYAGYLERFFGFFRDQTVVTRFTNIAYQLTVFTEVIRPFPTFLFLVMLLLSLCLHARKYWKCVYSSGQVTFFYILLYMLWWVFISSQNWWRHLLPLYFFALLMVSWVIHEMLREHSSLISRWTMPRQILAIIALSFFVLAMVGNICQTITLFKGLFQRDAIAMQREVANEVAIMIKEKGMRIGYRGWWQTPEITFFHPDLVVPLDYDCPDQNCDHTTYILIPPDFKKKATNDYKEWIQDQSLIYAKYNYEVWTWTP